jgi:hypothetical protein
MWAWTILAENDDKSSETSIQYEDGAAATNLT